ncbi:MAG: SH3 domain-containing protein [Synergistaceae bacterium]|jgi:predicted nucleic acid-binding Zn ribbon protein|nr:SH3 domain-containing protein [Synergistaceae bacterium]
MSENETQTCPKCGAPAKEGDVFCRSCGAKHFSGVSEIKPPPEIKRVCPNCGNTLRPAARFCDLCGEECVKVRRERRRGKRKKSGCFFIFVVLLLCLVAGVSAIVGYGVSKNMSFKETCKDILISVWGNLFASAPEGEEPKEAKEEPDGAGGTAVSEDPYERAISNDSLTVVTPIAEDEPDMSPPDLRPGGEEGQNPSGNTDGGSTLAERDEERSDTAENMSSDADSGAFVLASPLDATPESGDETAPAEGDRQGSSMWTEQDSEGYSTVAADDRFFTASQTPSLRGTVAGNRVNVRSAPNTASRVKGQMNNGAEVEIVRRFSSGKERYYWFEVHDSGGSGWVYGEFIKPEMGENKVPAVSSVNTGEPNGNPAAETVINTSP